jgi:hypothetical protein
MRLEKEDKPPIFSTWERMYVFVLCFHAILLTAFYAITKILS